MPQALQGVVELLVLAALAVVAAAEYGGVGATDGRPLRAHRTGARRWARLIPGGLKVR